MQITITAQQTTLHHLISDVLSGLLYSIIPHAITHAYYYTNFLKIQSAFCGSEATTHGTHLHVLLQ